MKKYIVENDIKFYIINATKLGQEIGLGNRINMIMQSAFFKLADVIPVEDAVGYLKESIVKTYGLKGEKIVSMNQQAVDSGIDCIHAVSVPADWANAVDEAKAESKAPKFIEEVLVPMNAQKGDDLLVSTFKDIVGGTFPDRDRKSVV